VTSTVGLVTGCLETTHSTFELTQGTFEVSAATPHHLANPITLRRISSQLNILHPDKIPKRSHLNHLLREPPLASMHTAPRIAFVVETRGESSSTLSRNWHRVRSKTGHARTDVWVPEEALHDARYQWDEVSEVETGVRWYLHPLLRLTARPPTLPG